MSRKSQLAEALFTLKVAEMCRAVRQATKRELPILAYHRVLDIDPNDLDSFPFDTQLISASAADFKWQMEFIRDRYDPISFRHVINWMAGKGELPRRPIIVTFDDGYDDNYRIAFPILQSLEVPATIFVATGYIGANTPFWFDLVEYILIKNVPSGVFSSSTLNLKLDLTDKIASRRLAARTIVRALKRTANRHRLEYLAELEARFGGVGSPVEAQLSRSLDWSQVREMVVSGIEFGSHSVSHPILSSLDDEELSRELLDSRERLEREIGKEVQVIAYPVGGRGEFDRRVMEYSERAGYELGVSYVAGVNSLKNLPRYSLRRHHVEMNTSCAYFASMLGIPEVFG